MKTTPHGLSKPTLTLIAILLAFVLILVFIWLWYDVKITALEHEPAPPSTHQ